MLPAAPPQRTEANAALREGSTGWPVYSLQRALNDAAGGRIAPDGIFGATTAAMIRGFQRRNELVADGIVGPTTKRVLCEAVCRRVVRGLPQLPWNIARGFARGEGGDNPAAVNWSVSGGVDCGLWQIRVYGAPYDMQALGIAFSPYQAGVRAMGTLLARARDYASPHRSCPFSPLQLGVLAHNWPWAAQTYWRYGRLPQPGRAATWTPVSLPASARTYAGWCSFYVKAMGA